MRHLDLFSGIGGFAIAVDEVWPGSEHIFCDNDKFCQQVLKKHWPNSTIYGDIRNITNAYWYGLQEPREEQQTGGNRQLSQADILTGGFPCQPFSAAGKRKGTEDDRHLWPEMFRVIRLTKPTWVIAENVRGLLTIEGGLVFEQVCLDLEGEGYEVQPFIIPAVAVNAPHRRDRVWIVAFNTKHNGCDGSQNPEGDNQGGNDYTARENQDGQLARPDISRDYASHTECQRPVGGCEDGGDDKGRTLETKRKGGGLVARSADARCDKDGQHNVTDAKSGSQSGQYERQGEGQFRRSDWEQNWLEVATKLCRVDDGLSEGLDFASWSKAGHRTQRLKALGNAIVPQVAIEIMKAINAYSITR